MGGAPPEPELLLEALPDTALLDAELLDAELLLPPALAVLEPPAPPPPALAVEVDVEVLELPPDPTVEVGIVVDVELGDDDSSALDPPPVPSSLPAAQLVGNVLTTTAPAANSKREATRRPTLARPVAKKERGSMGQSSTRKPGVRLRPRASGELARDWCSVRAHGPGAAREAAGGGKQRCRC